MWRHVLLIALLLLSVCEARVRQLTSNGGGSSGSNASGSKSSNSGPSGSNASGSKSSNSGSSGSNTSGSKSSNSGSSGESGESNSSGGASSTTGRKNTTDSSSERSYTSRNRSLSSFGGTNRSHPVVEFSSCNDTQTSHPGPICGRLRRRCLKEATCVSNTCRCPDRTPIGDGYMECAPRNTTICSVDCDPHVTTNKGSNAPLNYPCWYRVTKFLAPVRRPHWMQHKARLYCKVQVRALNVLTTDNLFFVGHLVVDFWIVKVTHTNGHCIKFPNSYIRFSVDYRSANQSITTGNQPWRVYSGGQNFYRNKAFAKIYAFWDCSNRFAVLDMRLCRVRVKYRPFVEGQHPQMYKPGVTTTVPFPGVLFKYPAPFSSGICFTCNETSSAFREFGSDWGFRNPGQAALYTVLMQRGLPSSLELNPRHYNACRDARKDLQSADCDDFRNRAVRFCGPILNQRLKCVKPLQEDNLNPMTVFKDCLKQICFGNATGTDCYFRQVNGRCNVTRIMNRTRCNETMRDFL